VVGAALVRLAADLGQVEEPEHSQAIVDCNEDNIAASDE